jgi:hypothetical protein
VTNTYWETNFRAHQPGVVGARYRLLPHAGPFDEAAAHRFGIDAGSLPIVHHLREEATPGTLLPSSGSLLRLPEAPVLTLHVWPEDGDVHLRLLNASDEALMATVGSGVLRIAGARRCGLLGAPESALEVGSDGSIAVRIEPRRIATVRLTLEG